MTAHAVHVVARAQSRVLLTGDPTAHAEVNGIRKAIRNLSTERPSTAEEHHNEGTLEYVPRQEGSSDPVPERARMLQDRSVHISAADCPMGRSAMHWSRIDTVYFSCDPDDTRRPGVDDSVQYGDFQKPFDERRIQIEHVHPEFALKACEAWTNKPDRHPY